MDLGTSVPITIGGNNAIGEVSARQRSRLDLQPGLTTNTRLADLNGGRGLGITLGTIAFSFEGQDRIEVDLTGAENVGNVLSNRKRHPPIRRTVGQTILQPGFGAVTLEGGAIRINVAPGADPPPSPQPTLEFFESGQGSTAEDLGLTAAPFANDAPTGADLRPRLTDVTPLDALDPDSGLTLPLGSIRIRFERADQSIVRQIDLSSAQTIGDVRNLIETNAPGVRVQINAQGTGLDVYNEISGPRMIIEEVAGGPETAAQLGIRTLSADTPGADFNDGRGIGIISGSINPVTGLPDPDRDVDFVITLGNGDSFTVDLRPEDLATTATILARINQQAQVAADAGLIPPGSFEAGLTDDRNGIAFRDPLNLGPPQFQSKNNSTAARDLGLLNGSYDAASATFIARSSRCPCRQPLYNTHGSARFAPRDDSVGITIAGDNSKEPSIAWHKHALVGTYATPTPQSAGWRTSSCSMRRSEATAGCGLRRGIHAFRSLRPSSGRPRIRIKSTIHHTSRLSWIKQPHDQHSLARRLMYEVGAKAPILAGKPRKGECKKQDRRGRGNKGETGRGGKNAAGESLSRVIRRTDVRAHAVRPRGHE